MSVSTLETEVDLEYTDANMFIGREADSNDSLKKIPETFNSILQSKGVFAATKTMVGLLFSE